MFQYVIHFIAHPGNDERLHVYMQDGREGCLTEAGHVCLGEKHSEIINNQKIAISQLREKLNELELAKPPGIVAIVRVFLCPFSQ